MNVENARWCLAAGAAALAWCALGASGEWDANVSDFPRLAGESDDAPRFMRAVAAAPNGVLRRQHGLGRLPALRPVDRAA